MDKIKRVRNLCNGYRQKLDGLGVSLPSPVGRSRIKIVSISDLHVPFCREDLLKEIIREHSGADYCVVNGDLFDSYLISTFPKNKEIPFAIEYVAVFEIVRLLSQHFKQVILVDGNHDKNRYQREMGKVNPTLRFMVKTSPLKGIADGIMISRTGKEINRLEFPNVIYTGDQKDENQSWWTRIGQCLFVHRTAGFAKNPMANAVHANKWFIDRGTQFQAIVNGHSHHLGKAIHKGKIVIDQGCLCYPMEYESSGKMTMAPVDLGYAIVEMDRKGNVDPEATRPIYLGTYQTP